MMKLPAIHLRWANRDRYLYISLLAEFVGTALYQILGGVSGDDPLSSAFALAGVMYATKYISGGHLNPAVSLAALLSGHIDWIRGTAYMGSQFLGAIFGALIQAWISPDNQLGHTGPGCFAPIKDLSNWGLLGWETFMTFLLIAVMYASVFVQPGHGDASPLAAGVTLFAALATGGAYTGMSPLNPARTFAGALIFKCFWRWAFVYIAAHLTAALLAAAWALTAFGKGIFFQRGSAAESLREGLLAGTEPMGPVPATFAPTGHHYAGSQPYSTEHGAGHTTSSAA